MALTFATGMTLANAGAEAITNWGAWRVGGSGAAPTPAADNVTFKENANSISARIGGSSASNGGLLFDYYAANANSYLNLTTVGNEVLAVWALCTSASALNTAVGAGGRDGGLYIIVQSSTETGNAAPTVFAKWFVSGKDVYPGGWVLFMIDTRKTPSASSGSYNLAQVRRIGIGIDQPAALTLRSDNLYIDAMWYGRPIYSVVGDGSATASWADFLANSSPATPAAGFPNGLIQDIGGVLQLSCGIKIGSTTQTQTTTFSDSTGRTIVFRRSMYYQGGNALDGLNYADYYSITAVGAAGHLTSVTFGTVVGTGDNRQGVLGGTIMSANVANQTWKIDFQTGIAYLSAVNLYGLTCVGAKGGVLLESYTLTSVISCSFINCGEIDPGTTGNGATVLSCTLVDPTSLVSANYGLRIHASHNIKFVSFVTSGTPATQHMVNLADSGTYHVTFNGLKFYGDYSSATLWHGDMSNATSTTATLDCSNQASPTAAEFSKTGNAGSSVSVSNPVTLSLTDMVEDSEVRIYSHGTTTELAGIETVGVTKQFDYPYTYVAGTYVDIVIFSVEYENYRMDNYLLRSVDTAIPIKQIFDRQYANP